MKLYVKKLVNVFLFSFLSFTLLYISYGLILKYFIKYSSFMEYTGYFIFIIAFILSIFFNKSRVFLMLLLLSLFYLYAGPFLNVFVEKPAGFLLPFSFIIFIISINIIIFSFYRERGIFTSYGLKRIFFIMLQMYSLYYIISNDVLYKKILIYFNSDFFPFDFWSNYFQVSDLLLILWFLAFIIVLRGLTQAEDYAFLFILIHLFVALFFLQGYGEIFIRKITFLSALVLNAALIKDFYSMAYLDELTGLPARRALREELLKLGNNYSVAMLDIDHFKKFNDKYGHDVGDQVLKMVAAVMKRTKGGAKVFRYGGEEFTILFSGKGVEEVSIYLDELRKNIADRPFTIRSKKRSRNKSKNNLKKKSKKNKKNKSSVGTEKVKITVSIGAAEKKNTHKNANEVIKDADKVLYKAKRKGRNRVIY